MQFGVPCMAVQRFFCEILFHFLKKLQDREDINKLDSKTDGIHDALYLSSKRII